MINWNIGCPKHVEDLKLFYPRQMLNQTGSFVSSMDDLHHSTNQFESVPHYLMDCKVGSADKQNILEAINLALFNLNNEEEDQNLKSTG